MEAAAEAIHYQHGLGMDESVQVAKTVLEAARISAARAWDEGQKSGMRHAARADAAEKIGHPELPGPPSHNPYRSGT